MSTPRGSLPNVVVPLARVLLGAAVVALVVAGLLSASGSSAAVLGVLSAGRATAATPPARVEPAIGTVVIRQFVFAPDRLTVPAGARLTVINEDGVIHTLTALDGSFDTGEIPARRTGSCTAPSRPGTYAYKDSVLPFMTGTLVVT